MSTPDLAEIARRQNERDAAAGHCTRYVEDDSVLMRVATMMAAHQEGGGDGRAA